MKPKLVLLLAGAATLAVWLGRWGMWSWPDGI